MRRLIDILAGTLLLAICIPVLVLVALLVLTSMGRPILYRSERAGLRGNSFSLVKFRSMVPGSSSDEHRLTRLGRFVRRTSLDELPGLWNVLRGDMSLVGPRPLPPTYIKRYSPTQVRRLEVKPGITGWAQVKGRNSISWNEKLALDVWYIDNRSLWLDLKILAMTVLTVFRRDGISAPGHATMPEFFGEESNDG